MDFFVVGQPKAGTTALYQMLRQHPKVYMPDLKEPQFFAADMRRRYDPKGWPVLPTSSTEYLALFEGATPDRLRGEASTLYMPSRVAAAEIARFNPSARVIAVVREPASLLRSLHLQALKDRNETERDLRRALALESRRKQGKSIPRSCYRPQELFYADHVRYVEQLERFADLDPLVLVYDDLRSDSQGAVGRVLDFLGLERIAIEPTVANPSVVVRSHLATRTLRRVSTGRARWLGRIVPRTLRRRGLRAAYDRLRVPPPAADPRLTAELKARFRPEVVALSEYLGRDLTRLWD